MKREKFYKFNPAEVTLYFGHFKNVLKDFRDGNGLTKEIKNVHEILTAMTDKHGRICRYIKHQERNDPKDNWQEELVSGLTGYIVYAMMLLEFYGIEHEGGMIKELKEALKQHKPTRR
jgi:hypothetical protein